ncbi:hypothetical protein MKX01_013955, partial [Papaver californicum]
AVKITNITYEDLKGTTDIRTPSAITMGCSRVVGCTGLHFKDISFTPAMPTTKLVSTCINARGTVLGRVDSPLTCLPSG